MRTPPRTPRVGGASLEDAIRFIELASALSKAALEKKALDVVILDMRNLVSYTDAFVLCTATNPKQVKAIAEAVREVAKKEFGLLPTGSEGLETSRWALVDFGEVVVHVFDGPLRGFYNLDGLWADAPRLPVPHVEGAPKASEQFFGL